MKEYYEYWFERWVDWISRAGDHDLLLKLKEVESDFTQSELAKRTTAILPDHWARVYNMIEEELIKRGLL